MPNEDNIYNNLASSFRISKKLMRRLIRKKVLKYFHKTFLKKNVYVFCVSGMKLLGIYNKISVDIYIFF